MILSNLYQGQQLNERLIYAATLLLILTLFGTSHAQTNDGRGRNNPYSPSPPGKAKIQERPATPVKSVPTETAYITPVKTISVSDTRPTVAQRTFEIAKTAERSFRSPSEIYKVGVGDVLYVNLKNSAGGSGYYTVRANGTIDFPLAGDNIVVADQTVDNIEENLESGITLFPDPSVEVKVREYASHKVTVSGMVANAGEKSLQREAIPLFVIRADAVLDPKATRVIITRAPLIKAETYDIRDSATDNVLVYPGNAVEFTTEYASHASGGGFYYIGGEIVSAGQKEITIGMTLYQAVMASGGSKGDPKKAIIRRKNDQGVLTSFEHNLRAIKDGKAPDPAITSGDVVEIRK
jgi:protein involved in polysaccharide export with SLBB domain